MAFGICRLKNISGSQKTWQDKVFEANEIYNIPDIDRVDWASDDEVIQAITSDELQIGSSSEFFTSYSDQIDWLKDY